MDKERNGSIQQPKTSEYDIFISYRRQGGAQFARILQLILQQRGYRVFLDYDELTDGIFSEKIQAAIKEAPVFMLILSKGAMDRCVSDGDWVRREILLAIEQQKHIVPVNPDNSFEGFPDDMPAQIKEVIGSHQHSEINFGQALGVTIDLMIKNRLVPTLGERTPQGQQDEDFETAKATLEKTDRRNRFLKRIGIATAATVVTIAVVTGVLLWQNQKKKDAIQQEQAALDRLRMELQEKHEAFGLILNNDLTREQMTAIDTMLCAMSAVRPDTLWMSQFEFTSGLWHAIKGEPVDEAQRHMPMTNVSFGEIGLFLADLANMTNLGVTLPSAEEWCYAAHGGTYHETTLYVGDDDAQRVAWYADNSGGAPHPSDGQQGKEPNMLDLFDMSGNVAELCNTPFTLNPSPSSLYTICGGHYNSPAADITADACTGFATDAKAPTVGFRLAIRKN